MPPELAPPWRAALEEAWEAYRAGSHPIGAVVLGPDGRLLARGRNRVFDLAPGGHVKGNPLAHAEMNALLELDYAAVDPHACSLFTTTEPCPLCLGALYMSGVRHLRFGARDGWCGSVDLLGATPYLARKPIAVSGPWPQIEALVIVLQSEFALRQDTRRAQPLLEADRSLSPAAVALGEALHRTGELWRLALADAPLDDALGLIAAGLALR